MKIEKLLRNHGIENSSVKLMILSLASASIGEIEVSRELSRMSLEEFKEEYNIDTKIENDS